MSLGELNLYLKLLPAFSRHYLDNPQSLLAKIVGVFTVRSGKMGAVHIMLMENTLRLKQADNLKYIFDLKGSTVDRKVKGKTKNSTTLKDINYLMVSATTKGLTHMKNKIRVNLQKVLSKDAEFLRLNGLMDYSLLLGIEKV